MKKDQKSIDEYLDQLRKYDPEIAAEVDAAVRAPMLESARGIPGAEITPETVVLTKGRPVLDIRKDAAVLVINEAESKVWQTRLEDARDRLASNIPAVGRIELANHPRGVDWLGTGWLIAHDIVVTNRHVAEVFAHAGVEGFQFRVGLDGTRVRAGIDFLEEFENEADNEFPVLRIVHIEKESGPDIAFLRVAPVADRVLPTPVQLAETPAAVGDQVAVIGYPARDAFFPNPVLMDRIFNHRYDKKRLAPGLIIGAADGRLFHDCTTLGGNSGGAVVALGSGKAVALHFAGTLFERNHAVPAATVSARLEQTLRQPARTRPTIRETDDRPMQPVANMHGAPGQTIDATIPIHVRIELGDVPSAGVVSSHAWPASGPDDSPAHDGDLIEVSEARPEDFLDRDGYDPAFLGAGVSVPLPELTGDTDDVLSFEFDGQQLEVLDYRHFSVVMSASRRICRYSACNLDGKKSRKKSRRGWRLDPRIPRNAQVMKECYGNLPRFSRGHMTRREDPVWGSSDQASQGNTDSMHVTNAVPQIQPFNAGIWLDLEDYALDNAREDDMRICVFTGPFLSRFDPIRFGVKIPITFWKIIAFIHDDTGELSATGYTMSQKSFIGEQEFVFGQHENRQRPISEIERRAGLFFGQLAAADPLADQPESVSPVLTHPEGIRWK